MQALLLLLKVYQQISVSKSCLVLFLNSFEVELINKTFEPMIVG